jgi:hypothetical protein
MTPAPRRPRECCDARADVHGHPGDVGTAHLDFSGVNARPYSRCRASDGVEIASRSRSRRWDW